MSLTHLALFEILGDPGIKRPAAPPRCVLRGGGEERHTGTGARALAAACAPHCEASWEQAELPARRGGLGAGVPRSELGLQPQV